MGGRKRRNLNLTVTYDLFEYIEQESKRTGLTRSGLIAVALDTYRKQNMILENMGSIERLLQLVKEERKKKEIEDGV